jgi:ferredoxin--NADP+ reductase
MSNFSAQQVLSVHHWNDTLFSFRTTRDPGLRFINGQFVMIGLPQEEQRPLTRAYSIASANHDEYLEFLSIKVPNGPLTSKLQHLAIGDEIVVSRKPTGTLVLRDLRRQEPLPAGHRHRPGAIHQPDPGPGDLRAFRESGADPRRSLASDLAYGDFIEKELPQHEFFADLVRDKLIYYPTVTREAFRNQGRITDLVDSGRLFADIGLPPFDPARDRAMLCGSPAMLKDCCELLDSRGFEVSPHIGAQGDYVIERAFVDK